ncbi:MAG: hypothetical protein MHPSP_002222 [Paramarteilia canceri]
MGNVSLYVENCLLHSMCNYAMTNDFEQKIKKYGGSAICEVDQYCVRFLKRMTKHLDVWIHLLLRKYLYDSRKNSYEYMSYPDLNDPDIADALDKVDLHSESAQLTERMIGWKLFVLLESDVDLKSLKDVFESTFSNFLSVR